MSRFIENVNKIFGIKEEKEEMTEIVGEIILFAVIAYSLLGATIGGIFFTFAKAVKLAMSLKHNSKLKKVILTIKDNEEFIKLANEIKNEKSELKKQELAKELKIFLTDRLGYSTVKDIEKTVQTLAV